MKVERRARTAGVGCAAIVGGVVLSIVCLIGIAFLVIWRTRESPSTYARKHAQSFFVTGGKRTATVTGCTRIGSNADALIYRCRIVAPDCTRTHRFAVERDRMYGTVPVSVSVAVGLQPCGYPSD